jgi:cell division protein FtsB
MRTGTIPATATSPTELPRLPTRRAQHRWLRGVFVLIAMIVLADALVGEQSLSSERRARKQYEAVGEELSALRGQNARLREEVRRLRDDPATIEYVARKDLGLARRGEILVHVK